MAITTGILTGGANAHQTTSEEANAWATDFISEGIVGSVGSTNGIAPTTGSFSINAQGTPDMTVAVGSGTAYVTGTPSSQASQTFRVKNSATSNVTISANSSGSTKYDWVYIKLDATKLNTPNSAADDVATLVTSRSSSASSDDGTPPTYGYPLAVVTVANGATTITNSNIRDLRTQSTISSTTAGTSNDWYSLALSPNTVTALGNRSYSLVFNSTNLTSYISNGMRLKLPRTVTAPTQCTSLNGTTQYYNKTSPAGMTFTDDFVVSAWVKLSAYPTTNPSVIASRYNGTSGFVLRVETTGQVMLIGLNGGASNYSFIESYQSIPLNKWVHISAQLDMSAFTATTTTSYVMLDGKDVPSFVGRAGTNPTALVQAGDLNIGTANSGTGYSFFNGKIAQVAIYSAKVTQATILASMNQTLTGSETSLVSAYTFNNSINDLSANANNLTANGGALATTVDSPMNATEYGIVMANSFSTNTTLTVQVPEGYSLPTSGGIGTVSYSTQKTPYGFISDESKWTLTTISRGSNINNGASTGDTYYNVGSMSLSVPVGVFKLTANINVQATMGAATSHGAAAAIGSSAGNSKDVAQATGAYSASADVRASCYMNAFVRPTTATSYYINIASVDQNATNLYLVGATQDCILTAECTYV